MYKYRLHTQVRYGHFAEYVEVVDEIKAVLKARNLREGALWVQTVGVSNDVVWEIEFPDLATFERETNAFHSDPEIMKLVRRGAELVVQGSTRDELLEPAPTLA